MIRHSLRILLAAFVLLMPALAHAQEAQTALEKEKGDKPKRGDILIDMPDTETQMEQLRLALVRLPIAAGLASGLAFPPRRRGTPHRQAAVIHTQIILAVLGSAGRARLGSSPAPAS